MNPRLFLALAAAVLPACLSAQSITVVGNRSLRPTAVLGPHVRYLVAADTDGAIVLSDLSVPPVTFTGTIRIDGIQPGARGPETASFPDTVRYENDGRVTLLLADAAGRPPITVEVVGARGAPAGRIMITAQRWPIGRVMLVTLSPADLYELSYRSAGLGVRDRIRLDDRAGFAYLTDTTAGPTTVAIGFGRGAQGRIQGEASSVLLTHDFGGVEGRERRPLGGLSMIIEPSLDDNRYARAEIIFGVGNSEAEAARAARAASDEAASTPRESALRWRTPSPDAAVLLKHIMAAAGWMLDWEVLDGQRTIPASAMRPVVSAENAWYGSVIAAQRGDSAAVCGSYRVLRGGASGPRAEVAPRLGSRGRYLFTSMRAEPQADAALVLLAHACYGASRDSTMLRGDFPALAAAAGRAADGTPAELAADAVERLTELDDELSRISGGARASSGDSLRAVAARLPQRPVPAPMALWRVLSAQAQQGLQREYGRLSDGGDRGGLSLRQAGEFVGAVVGDLFGVTEYLDRLEIAPQVGGIADDQVWQLDGWLLGSGDTLGVTYRPADRAAEVRLTAARRQRLVLRFSWLTPASCVTVRRGPDAEAPGLVAQADGSFYLDIRGAFDPATIRLAALPCAGP